MNILQYIRLFFATKEEVAFNESTTNKTININSSSTDTQYSSAKAVYTALTGKADLVHTHSYENLTNKPTIPSKTSDLTNDSNYLATTDVINDTSHTDTDKPLSANIGKTLQDEIDNLTARGRFLALWNCATGLPSSNPQTSPYTYKTGDYYVVGNVSDNTNYKPSGTTYTTDVASTTVESNSVSIDDVYYYDGSNWKLQINTQKTISFSNISGSPSDNSELASALNGKASNSNPVTLTFVTTDGNVTKTFYSDGS